ncbi:MAG TPA: T9SS type A sorting domain-containing protein [Bacteroidia bacterium]|nr:T9SS type A sorting domain-containing protein [Bacteroidia bacterium]
MKNLLFVLTFLFCGHFAAASLPTPSLSSPSNGSNNQPAAINFSWSNVSGATNYELRLALNPSFTNSVSYFDSNHQTFITDIYFGVFQYWQVRAMNATDTSAWSTTFSFKTADHIDLTTPFDGASNLNPSLEFDWTSLNGIFFYEIEIDTLSSFNSPALHSELFSGSSGYTVDNLYFNAVYYWRVRAINAVDTTAWTSTNIFTTIGQIPLQLPLSGSINLPPSTSCSWFGISGITGYEFQYDTLFDFSSPTINSIITGTNNSATMTNLLFHHFYFWRVRAFHDLDSSDWSATNNFFVIDRLQNISPANSAQNLPQNVNFAWSSTSAINGYVLELDTLWDFSSGNSQLFTTNDTTFTVNNLALQTTYYWRVRTYNNVDSTYWSIPREFRTIDQPLLISPDDFAMSTAINVPLIWENIPLATAYEVNIDTSIDFNSPLLINNIQNDTTYQCADLFFGTNYYWKVRVILSNDTLNWSPARLFTTIDQVGLIIPLDLSLNQPLNTVLLWEREEGINHFDIEVDTVSSFATAVTYSSTTDSLTTGVFDYNTHYYWRVRMISNVDTSLWSNIYQFTTKSSVGIAENTISDIVIAPNPSHGYFTISGIENKSISIFDLQGKIIIPETKSDNNSISIENFASGMYFLRISEGDKIEVVKVMVD